MRSKMDRIRHSILFEFFGIILATIGASFIIGKDVAAVGTLNILAAIVALIMNYIFNLIFDLVLIKLNRSIKHRSVKLRCLHAILFEASLTLITVPLTCWQLNVGIFQAITIDLGIATFYVIYGFFYNLAYDHIFPLPEDNKSLKQNINIAQ